MKMLLIIYCSSLQFLVMGNEESLVGFPVKQVVPALVSRHMDVTRDLLIGDEYRI